MSSFSRTCPVVTVIDETGSSAEAKPGNVNEAMRKQRMLNFNKT
jgi:hypothetical protein